MHLNLYICRLENKGTVFPLNVAGSILTFPLMGKKKCRTKHKDAHLCNLVELQTKQWNTKFGKVTFCLRATFYSKSLDKQKEHERVRLCQAGSYSTRTTRSNQFVFPVSNLLGDYSICIKQAED